MREILEGKFSNAKQNALEILAVKRSIISEISKEFVNYIFAEFDRSSLIKNITDSLSLVELLIMQIIKKKKTKMGDINQKDMLCNQH